MTMTEPAPETAPAPVADAAPAADAVPVGYEPDFVVVGRDEVDTYATLGYRPGYVMLKP